MSTSDNIIKGYPAITERFTVSEGTATIPGYVSPPANTTATPQLIATIPHNLGFNPQFSLYADVPKIDWWGHQFLNRTVQLPIGYVEDTSLGSNNSNYYYLIGITDENNLYIYNNFTTYATPQDIPAIDVHYEIFVLKR